MTIEIGAQTLFQQQLVLSRCAKTNNRTNPMTTRTHRDGSIDFNHRAVQIAKRTLMYTPQSFIIFLPWKKKQLTFNHFHLLTSWCTLKALAKLFSIPLSHLPRFTTVKHHSLMNSRHGTPFWTLLTENHKLPPLPLLIPRLSRYSKSLSCFVSL